MDKLNSGRTMREPNFREIKTGGGEIRLSGRKNLSQCTTRESQFLWGADARQGRDGPITIDKQPDRS